MSGRIESKIPFVGLHAHSGLSPFDGLGMPERRICIWKRNECSFFTITVIWTLSFQAEHLKKMRADGKEFKAIYGCESYYPLAQKWRQMYEEHCFKQKRQRKKSSVWSLRTRTASCFWTHQRPPSPRDDCPNQTGLNNLFKLVSDSYQPENFYRYPYGFWDAGQVQRGANHQHRLSSGPLFGDFWKHRDKSADHVLSGIRLPSSKKSSATGSTVKFSGTTSRNSTSTALLSKPVLRWADIISTADSHYPRPELERLRDVQAHGWGGVFPSGLILIIFCLPREEVKSCIQRTATRYGSLQELLIQI